MMKKFFVLLTVLTVSGCIWIDDDDDDGCCDELVEEIIYVNQTAYQIDNFIDDEYVGTVAPNTELHVFNDEYDGRHAFFSDCVNCSLSWGPTQFTIREGETFRIYLEDSGSMSSFPSVQ